MATIKSYSDLQQSKKLTEILPLESVDMYYEPSAGFCTEPSEAKFGNIKYAHPRSIRCWSLAALLSVVPGGQVNRMANSDKWEASSWIDSDYLNAIEPAYYVEDYDNPVDACVSMVEKLHKLKLL